jgi:lipoprotein-anchoring transpeptidase ErfK/SrfK
MSRQTILYRHAAPTKKRRSFKWALAGSLVVALLFAAAFHYHHAKAAPTESKTAATIVSAGATDKPATPASAKPNPCAANTLDKLALVSISQRHLWACQGTTSVYDSAVVTGMENLPADLTPVGTYHVYGKETNLYLKGSDSTGSWNDYVYYWMPFLDNQYGAYGFHDATWRAADAFGNISPDSSNASHGCVELPLATAKWLYGWVVVGTAVTIES